MIYRCDQCAFWRSRNDGAGECHRHAPHPVVDAEHHIISAQDRITYWPITANYDSCADGEQKRG